MAPPAGSVAGSCSVAIFAPKEILCRAFGSWQEVVLDLKQNSNWINTIEKLRLDPVSSAGNVKVYIDSITLLAE